MKQATMQDVARKAGVSVATVSRVINDGGNVAPSTIKKINQAIKELDYQPNIWARSLRRQESKTILTSIPTLKNPYYANILNGIDNCAKSHGYMISIVVTNGDRKREADMLELLPKGQADAAILLTTSIHNDAVSRIAEQYPIIQCCEYCDDDQITHISIDNQLAAQQAVQYFIQQGHQKIAYIGSVNQNISTTLRAQGYQNAMIDAGLAVDQRWFQNADANYGFQSGLHIALDMLSCDNRPTAIFCISDVLALSCIRASRTLGLRVPEDISIIGFDNVEYASMFEPELSTIAQPQHMLGETSVQELLRQMQGKSKAGRSIFLEHQLLIRNSTTICKSLE